MEYDFAHRALKRISPVYDESKFIQTFFKILGDASLDKLREYFMTFREQSFNSTVTELGIAYRELMYSLDVRNDLNLEERRRLLGIKAAKQFPLNPAVMEQFILKNFGQKLYLDEKLSGYIRIYLNYIASAENFAQAISWIKDEKPAHLMLSTTIHLVEYTGDGGEGTDEIIPSDEDPPYPKTPEDKVNYPRIYAGLSEIILGYSKINLSPPPNELIRLNAGLGTFIGGEEKIDHARPNNQFVTLHAGVGIGISGVITIGHADIIQRKYFLESPTADVAIADVGIARGDYFIPPFTPDEIDIVKIFFGFPISRHRRVRGVSLPNARDDLTREEILEAGNYAVENNLIKNTAGEISTYVLGAALKTKSVSKVF